MTFSPRDELLNHYASACVNIYELKKHISKLLKDLQEMQGDNAIFLIKKYHKICGAIIDAETAHYLVCMLLISATPKQYETVVKSYDDKLSIIADYESLLIFNKVKFMVYCSYSSEFYGPNKSLQYLSLLEESNRFKGKKMSYKIRLPIRKRDINYFDEMSEDERDATQYAIYTLANVDSNKCKKFYADKRRHLLRIIPTDCINSYAGLQYIRGDVLVCGADQNRIIILGAFGNRKSDFDDGDESIYLYIYYIGKAETLKEIAPITDFEKGSWLKQKHKDAEIAKYHHSNHDAACCAERTQNESDANVIGDYDYEYIEDDNDVFTNEYVHKHRWEIEKT